MLKSVCPKRIGNDLCNEEGEDKKSEAQEDMSYGILRFFCVVLEKTLKEMSKNDICCGVGKKKEYACQKWNHRKEKKI